MRRFLFVALLVFLPALAARAAPSPRLVEVTRVIDANAGGDYTRAMVVEIGAEKFFLKSLHNRPYPLIPKEGGPPKPTELTRYCNFEADILAHQLFFLMGIQSPRAAVVRLRAGSPAADTLGEIAMAMEYVDQRLMKAAVQEGYWPGRKMVAIDQFIGMALIDILAGNADRRDPNFFITIGSDGLVHPVPIDNNAGFSTMLVWLIPSNLVNFYPSYTGVGKAWPWDNAGTIANIVFRGGEFHHVHEHVLNDPGLRRRVLELAGTLHARLTDGYIDAMLDRLPLEIIPADAVVDPQPHWLAMAGVAPSLLFGPATLPLFGRSLYAVRLRELRETLIWRRDNLVEALKSYWKDLDATERRQSPVK